MSITTNKDGPVIIVVEGDTTTTEVKQMPVTPHQITDPDHYVIALKYEKSENFIELVMSHLTKFLEITELEDLLSSSRNGNNCNKLSNILKKSSWGFRKREIKSGIFGLPVTNESLLQIQRLMDFLSNYLEVEGLFRKPGNSNRIQKLQAAMETGVCIDFENSNFHAHDVASVLKTYIGDLPEPLLQDRYFECHLQIAGMMMTDSQGAAVCNKAKRIETLQLLLLLLPTENRTLLRGILNLLHQTARLQAKNKMNASNLSKMFAPNLLWPRKLKASQIQNNIVKLNDHVAFMIRHAKKILVAPQYIRDEAKKLHHVINSTDLSPDPPTPSPYVTQTPTGAVKRTVSGRMELSEIERTSDDPTETALKELFDHVQNMPQSAKKKKLVKKFEKHTKVTTPKQSRHRRSRTFGGLIKKRVMGVAKAGTSSGNTKADSNGKMRKKETFLHIPQPGSAKEDSTRRKPDLAKQTNRQNKSTDKLLPIPFPTNEVLETEID